jgi:Protein of unknown function (DUF3800)
VLYACYYDESKDDTSFGIGGYLAPLDTWVHLEWKWGELLKAWNIAYFKASECENGLGEFARYRDDPTDLKAPLKVHERDRLRKAQTQFIDAICSHHDYLHGVGAVTNCADFQRIISESADARRLLMDDPYYICLQLSLVAASELIWEANASRPKENQIFVKTIVDSHEEYSGKAKILYDKFREKNPRAAGVLLSLHYEDDIQAAPLQVADTIAYEVRKFLTWESARPERPVRPQLLRLCPEIYRIFRIDYDVLKVIIAKQGSRDTIPTAPVKMGTRDSTKDVAEPRK